MRGIVSRSGVLAILAVTVFLFSLGGTAMAQNLTIMHTNDMHSRMLAPPNADYTPGSTGDDSTVGGMARIATKVGEIRAARGAESIPVLMLDAGDFTMGTLFHLLLGEAEFAIMNHLGYDATCLGNHEFDMLPTGAAQIASNRGAVRVLATNLSVTDAGDPWGVAIEASITAGDILDTDVQTVGTGSNEIRVGYFGLMGEDAASVVNMPYGEDAYPIEFTDRVAAASAAVTYLKGTEGVDIVICLSHSGVNEPAYWTGEDVDLATAVPGIDVIISGHTHTLIPTPVTVGTTTIVQAKSYTQRLGVLDLEYNPGLTRWDVLSYDSVVIDDDIPGDAVTQALVDSYIADINTNILTPMGFAFSNSIAETDVDLSKVYKEEHGLGNLVTDAIRWSVDQVLADPSDPVVVAVESNGVIRSALETGATGQILTSDAFRTLPLGIDPVTEQAGYPLLSFCMSGAELFNAAWVNALAPFLDNSDYWLSWSGAGFQYIDFLPPLSMWQCVDGSDPTCTDRIPIANTTGWPLYRIAVNSYVASQIGSIKDLSYGLIVIEPKDCATGLPLESLDDAIVYEGAGDPLMQWEGFFDYLDQLPDTDTDGIPNIPARYAGPEGRMLVGCVVATAAYGSPLEEKVGVLRDFRDRILMKSQAGKQFVSFYYAHGVPVAEAVAQSEWLKAMVRVMLLPLVGVAKLLLLLV